MDYKQKKRKIYLSRRWQKLAEYVRQSHFCICEMCGKPNAREVHHIIPISETNMEDDSIVFNEKNLMLLCRACHNKIHNRSNGTLRSNEEIKGRAIQFDEDGNVISIE